MREICKLENLNEGLLIPNIPKKPCNSVLIIWKRNTLDAIRITLWKTRFIAFSKQFTPAHTRYFKPRICTFLGVWIIATLFWVQQILARQKLKTLLRHLYTHKNFSDRMIFFDFVFVCVRSWWNWLQRHSNHFKNSANQKVISEFLCFIVQSNSKEKREYYRIYCLKYPYYVGIPAVLTAGISCL